MDMEMEQPAVKDKTKNQERSTNVHRKQPILRFHVTILFHFIAIHPIGDEAGYSAATNVAHTTRQVQ